MKKSRFEENKSEKCSEIKEDEICRFVRYQIIENLIDTVSTDNILYQFVKLTKCDTIYAKIVLEKMYSLGLNLCYDNLLNSYSIQQFASLRGYVTDDELTQVNQMILSQQQKEEEFEQKFMEKYGNDEGEWSAETWKKYEAMDLN